MNYKTPLQMKKTFLTFIVFIGAMLTAQAQNTFTISVEFSGMESDKGNLYVALYNSEKDFLKNNFKGAIVKIQKQKALVKFKDVPEGVYAVSCFHDANDNKKMDTNFFGIPKEPIGISNDAKGFMGPPKYKDAKFLVNKDLNLKVTVN